MTYEMHNYAALLPINKCDYNNNNTNNNSNTNNSSSNKITEKYSLRQRHKSQHKKPENEFVFTSSKPKNARYSEKNASDCIAVESSKTAKSTNAKKVKAAPLSKYRRKTANARERTRMKEINQAFENLRNCVPTAITDEEACSANEKLTKITTLRLAMKYISVLTEALNNDDMPVDDILECKKYGELNSSFDALQSVASCKPVVQPEKTLSKSTTKVQNKNVTKLSANSVCRKNLSKRRQRKQTPRLVDIHESNKSKVNRNVNNVNDSNYTQANTIADLTNLLLESDGESLHLSEHCLSPLQANYINLLESTEMASDLATNIFSSYESQPFELNLRLLEANAGSLDIPMEQHLPLCSPLAVLDTFDDLYDFPIHSSLDLFST